jgi:hypothetical protein
MCFALISELDFEELMMNHKSGKLEHLKKIYLYSIIFICNS